MSINRQALIDNVTKGGQQPAFFFARPSLAAAPHQEDYPEYVLGRWSRSRRNCSILPGRAWHHPRSMEPITLAHNESEGHARIAQAIQQMWTEALGITVEIQTQEWAVYLRPSRATMPQVFLTAGAWTTPTPTTSCLTCSTAGP
jgi:oligopeptide transport system substrate-binding protein